MALDKCLVPNVVEWLEAATAAAAAAAADDELAPAAAAARGERDSAFCWGDRKSMGLEQKGVMGDDDDDCDGDGDGDEDWDENCDIFPGVDAPPPPRNYATQRGQSPPPRLPPAP